MAEKTMWDLVVIGGGSAGLVASQTASGFGARVLLIEGDRLGGECLWTGCVPSKTLIAAAQVAAIRQPAPVDFVATMSGVHEAIRIIEPVDSRETVEAAGVSVAEGIARFTSPRSLSLNGVEIEFSQAVIATGTRPTPLRIPGSESLELLTSESFWQLSELPAELVILGGDAIACELGQAMARLGSHVTIVHRGPRLLLKEEEAAARIVQDALLADGVTILSGRTAVSVASSNRLSGSLTLDSGQTLHFDRLLVAVGRQPDAAGLNPGAAGIALDDAGFVRVDATLRTSNRRIWAAGDITGLPPFTHTAGVNGSVAATNAILGLRRKAETRVIPRVTYTSPELAAVGLQASDADPSRHRVITQHHDYSDRAVSEFDTSGFTQIVVDRRGRILGGTIVGTRAGETVCELALAVYAKLSTTAVASTIHPYPTHSDPLWHAAVNDVRFRLGRGATARGITALRRLRSRAMR